MATMFVIPVYTGGIFDDRLVALVFESESEAKEFLSTELPHSPEKGSVGGSFFHNLSVTEEYDIIDTDEVEEGRLYKAYVDVENIRDGMSALIYSDKVSGKKDLVGEVIARNSFLY